MEYFHSLNCKGTEKIAVFYVLSSAYVMNIFAIFASWLSAESKADPVQTLWIFRYIQDNPIKRMKASRITMPFVVLGMIMCGCLQGHNQPTAAKIIVAENDSVAVLCQVVDSAKDEFDVPEVAIWIKNKTTNRETKLYQTVRPDWHCWYMGDGNEFYPLPIDSILVTSKVTIYRDDPLQLIVEGCPDMRNIFSYFIDVPTRKAWYVPANQGYVGATSEEAYMIFQSYRYVSDPDIAGRYTFLQIFDEKGNMVDSLDLEHLHLRAPD